MAHCGELPVVSHTRNSPEQAMFLFRRSYFAMRHLRANIRGSDRILRNLLAPSLLLRLSERRVATPRHRSALTNNTSCRRPEDAKRLLNQL